jgi:hypothetical protein
MSMHLDRAHTEDRMTAVDTRFDNSEGNIMTAERTHQVVNIYAISENNVESGIYDKRGRFSNKLSP